MKNQTVRLEQALRFWEDHCFFYRLVYLFKQKTGHSSIPGECPQTGPILHWQSFRKHLLKAFNPDVSFELEQYCGTGEFRRFLDPQLLPFYLWHWTCCSRRIYHISDELQLLLRATSLDDVKWGDIRLPFDSFCIQLDDPIKDPRSGRQYDVLLITKNDVQSSRIDYVLLNQRLESYEATTLAQRQNIENDFSKKKFSRVSKRLKRMNDSFRQCASVVVSSNLGLIQDKKIEENDLGEVQHEVQHIDAVSVHLQAIRIIAGLCLYLRTLPSNSPHQSDWKPANKMPGRLDSKVITTEALICTVTSTHKLTVEEKRVLEEHRTGVGGYEVRAHFRSGHWRRPPGLGSDPTAERTVWVRPALVRRDRLPPDSVPAGSATVS